MAGPRFTFSWADYLILGVIICISLGIGIYHALTGSRQRTTSEYLVGDRKMSYLPVSLSYTATFMSSIFFLGTPAEMYAHGIQYLFFFYATILSNIIVAVFTVPLFHPLKITSAYEYLELRFQSVAVRKMGSCFGILTNLLYIGVVLFGPAVALEAVAGFPQWTSVLIIGLASVIYTAIGGIKAVVWTDAFQMFIMLAGLIAICIKSIFDIGGVYRFWELNKAARRFDISFSFDPTVARTFWTSFFGGASKWFSFSFNQSSILRYISIPSLRDARKMMLCSTPTFLILAMAASFEGLCAFAFYANKRCDPFEDGVLTNSNQILPYFIMELFHTLPGLPGLFLASLFSASLRVLWRTWQDPDLLPSRHKDRVNLRTLSSCLSSISACTLTDFVRPRYPHMTEFRATVIAKVIVVIFGCAGIGLSFVIMQITGTVLQIATSLLGAIDGPTCAMFVLGALVPCANKYGALTGGIVGIAMTLWVSIGASFSGHKTPWLPPAPVDTCPGNISGSLFPLNITSEWLNATGVTPLDRYTENASETEISGLDKWYSLSFLHHTLLGMLVTFIVGLIVSLLTGPTKPRDVNPAYVSYLVRRFYYSDERLEELDKELNKLHDAKMDYYVQSGENSEATTVTELPEISGRSSKVY